MTRLEQSMFDAFMYKKDPRIEKEKIEVKNKKINEIEI